MPYCPNCGNMVNVGDRFCASCGSVLQATPVSGAARSDYRIVLVSRGTCSRAVAIDMLSDLLGYSDPDAARIIDNAPMEAALGLTAIQAQYISQAITEYGMQVAIFNNDGYVDMGSRATSSVYNSDGSFLSAVADVLFGLTVGNRVSTFNRWTRPTPVLFRPSYVRVSPLGTLPPLPVYRRRRPAPRPTPIPTLRPGMVPPRRPVPTPAPQSTVAGSRPMPVHPAPVPNPGPVVPPRPVGPATPPNPPFPPTGPGGAGRNGRGGPGGMPGPGGGRRGV
ncbi:MAG: zinc ribbon domain-containing protein [bacterium]